MVPKNWPKEFIYTKRSFSEEIHPMLLSTLFAAPLKEGDSNECSLIENQQVHPDLEIRILKEPHPLASSKCYGKRHLQRGVFATADIPSGTVLGEYVGEIYPWGSWEHGKKGSMYVWVFSVMDNLYLVDGSQHANELAFVNDYRGLGERANMAETVIMHQGIAHFGYKTKELIKKGQEILANYKDTYWEAFTEKDLGQEIKK